METDRDAPAEYLCPSCGDRAPYPVRCDRCERAMIAPGAADPRDEVTRVERWWLLAGPVVGVAATWSACAAALSDGFSPHVSSFGYLAGVRGVFFGSWVLSGPLPVVVVTLLGVWLGRAAASAKVRDARRARRRARDLTAMAAAAPASLGGLRPGRVRVVATIVEAAPVYSDRGLPCAACENLADGGGSPAPRHSLAGRFTVRDEWGRRVAVDARHVRVVEGYAFDEEAHVPVGARVELVATARATAGDGTEGAAGYRDPRRAYELAGTADEPVLVRVLDAA